MHLKSIVTLSVIIACLSTACKRDNFTGVSSEELREERLAEEAKALEEEQRQQQKAEEARQQAIEEIRIQNLIEQAEIAQEEATIKVIEDQARAIVAQIRKKTKEHKAASKKWIGTHYNTLTVKNKDDLLDATVVAVQPTHVTFNHPQGVANIKFTQLPIKVQKACKYDLDVATLSHKSDDQIQEIIEQRLKKQLSEKSNHDIDK